MKRIDLMDLFVVCMLTMILAITIGIYNRVLDIYDMVEAIRIEQMAAEEKERVAELRAIVTEEPRQIGRAVEEEVEKPKNRYFDVSLDENLQDYIFEVSENYEIEPELVLAVIQKESSFNVNNVGDGGNSLGLMQIQPRWHKKRMNRLGCDDLMDPKQNILVGIDYLKELMDEGNGRNWALMAYNGGPSYANRLSREGKVSDYARNVLNICENLEVKS